MTIDGILAAAFAPGRPEWRREIIKNEKARKGNRNEPRKAEKEPPPSAVENGRHRGPRRCRRGGTSAERSAPAGAMSKRRWAGWTTRRVVQAKPDAVHGRGNPPLAVPSWLHRLGHKFEGLG